MKRPDLSAALEIDDDAAELDRPGAVRFDDLDNRLLGYRRYARLLLASGQRNGEGGRHELP
jgi:hypothetical protein